MVISLWGISCRSSTGPKAKNLYLVGQLAVHMQPEANPGECSGAAVPPAL